MNFEAVEQGYLFFKEGYFIMEESLKLALSYFVNPGKRIHLLYLASSMLLAFWVFQSSNSNKSFLQYLFPKRIWLSKSAFIDYSLFAFNSLVKILFIGPFVIFGFYLAFHVNEYMLVNFGFPKNPSPIDLVENLDIEKSVEHLSQVSHVLELSEQLTNLGINIEPQS